MKFNSENIFKSAAKTAKLHDLMRKGKVLLDLSSIQDSIPEKILEEIRKRIIEDDGGILSDISMVKYADYDEGILYYVYVEYDRYSVYDNARNIKSYAIKSAYAMRLVGFRMNTYGIVPQSDIPEIYIRSGKWTNFEYPIVEIELD